MYLELLPAVVMALRAIVFPNQFENHCCDWNWDGETITKARHVGLYTILSQLLSLLLSRSSWKCWQTSTLKVQMQAGDVFYAYNQVTDIVDSLKVMRNRSEKRVFTRLH